MLVDLCKTVDLDKIFYTIFLNLYELGFSIAAIFNRKARAGLKGREHLLSTINSQLQVERNNGTGPSKTVWMHCSSLGEFEQGRPVAEAIKKHYPNHKFILTFFSASGYEAMKNYAGADHIFYLPFDGKKNAEAVVKAFNPSLVLWVKYEYWFYYLTELKRRQVPVFLISGIFRPTQPFFLWYGGLWKEMLACFSHLFVQNEASAELLSGIGVTQNVTVSGDTRFDRVIEIVDNFKPVEYLDAFCGNAKVIVAGSTWEDDEAELTHYVKANPQIRFVIAPHEVDQANLKDLKQEFPNSLFYSELVRNKQANTTVEPGINVLLIDNVGMLSRLYHYADITYVGGGFGDEGVHNVLEAAVFGKPVLFGPEFEKFVEASDLVENGGAIPIENALEFEKVVSDLWNDEAQLKERGTTARQYVYEHSGASKQIIAFIQENRLLTN